MPYYRQAPPSVADSIMPNQMKLRYTPALSTNVCIIQHLRIRLGYIDYFHSTHQSIGIGGKNSTLISIQCHLELDFGLLSNEDLQRVNRSIHRHRLAAILPVKTANSVIRNICLFIFRLISFRKQIHQCLNIVLVCTYRHIIDIAFGKCFIQFRLFVHPPIMVSAAYST